CFTAFGCYPLDRSSPTVRALFMWALCRAPKSLVNHTPRRASHAPGGAGADERARQFDLADVGHAVAEAGLAEGADLRHIAERFHGDHHFQIRRVDLADKLLGAGPDFLHVVLEQWNVLEPKRLRLRRRHPRALGHRRQAEPLRVAALGPHGRTTTLEHEAHDAVLRPRVVPEAPRNRIRLGLTARHRA